MQNLSYYHSWQKRSFDICLSLVLLCVLTPVFCSVVLVLFATSGAPVLFWQERMGHKKQPFKMLKFRTMHVLAEERKKQLEKHNEAPWPMFKMKNDPRFTRFGKHLSRLGLDELPQFFHILTGKMSFVGPRPLPVHEAKKLPKNWNFRYHVRPGILSEWAIAPDRYVSLKRWRELELETLRNGSLISDIKLILRSCLMMMNVLRIKRSFFFNKRQVSLSRSQPRVARQHSPVATRKRASLGSFA